MQKVFANIRILPVLMSAILTINTHSIGAQTISEVQDKSQDLLLDSDENQIRESAQSQVDTSNSRQILRLEDTIRGNKEQPQVLTIVPWQLPVHQRINENTQWQLQVKPLASIERGAFLRKLAVVNEIKKSQEVAPANNIE